MSRAHQNRGGNDGSRRRGNKVKLVGGGNGRTPNRRDPHGHNRKPPRGAAALRAAFKVSGRKEKSRPAPASSKVRVHAGAHPAPHVPAPPPTVVVCNYTVLSATIGPKIVIVNESPSVKPEELGPVISALAKQVNEHFALPPPLGYGIGIASLRAATVDAPPRADEWVMKLTDKVDEAGAYGYHDQTEWGLPFLRVFPILDVRDGHSWTPTASHELLEALADPNVARCAVGVDGKVRAYEVGDPVENDVYSIDGVQVSNFVLPAYFEPMEKATKFDHMGLCKKAGEIRKGGYQSFYANGRWTEVTNGEKRGARAALVELKATRTQTRHQRAGEVVGAPASAPTSEKKGTSTVDKSKKKST